MTVPDAREGHCVGRVREACDEGGLLGSGHPAPSLDLQALDLERRVTTERDLHQSGL